MQSHVERVVAFTSVLEPTNMGEMIQTLLSEGLGIFGKLQSLRNIQN